MSNFDFTGPRARGLMKTTVGASLIVKGLSGIGVTGFFTKVVTLASGTATALTIGSALLIDGIADQFGDRHAKVVTGGIDYMKNAGV